MGHHSRFSRDRRSDFSETDPLRVFIRRYRKGILFALALGALLAMIFVVLATTLLFQGIIPTIMNTANTDTAQGVFVTVRDWLLQFMNTTPQEWISLLLQIGS